MDIKALLLSYLGQFLGLWRGLDADVQYRVWLGAGLILLIAIVAVWYPWMRRLMGHRRHRGTWYDERQYAELMQIFEETSQSRVLQHEDMVALRQWKHGDVKPLFGDKASGGYFEV